MLTRREVIADTLAPPAGLAQLARSAVTRRGYIKGTGADRCSTAHRQP